MFVLAHRVTQLLQLMQVMPDERFAFLLPGLVQLFLIWNPEAQDPIESDQLSVAHGDVCALSTSA